MCAELKVDGSTAVYMDPHSLAAILSRCGGGKINSCVCLVTAYVVVVVVVVV